MFITGKNPDTLIELMNTELVKVVDWLNVNKLSLNVKKTHFIIFSRRRDKIEVNATLMINNVRIHMTDNTKFLGVIIDKNLTFYDHIQYVKGKIARSLGILYKAKKYLNKKSLLTLYNSFINPLFMYCIAIWGNAPITYLDSLFKLQKRAVRVIASVKRTEHTWPIYKQLKILNLSNLYIYNVLLTMYKYHIRTIPEIFSTFFTSNRDIHWHYTRQQMHLHVPKKLSTLSTRSFRSSSVKIYNHFLAILPFDMTILTFKYHVKTYLIENDVSHLVR